ncbi:Beta-glucosidase 27 [Phytophthora ramorum]|uniref:Beta-glucosidase 27 n=1 Tax=Phytophthora ramorum TaxID=164328 RepID=UPI0030990F94|nr:Beta-glucosidase 27 [Phytophthora ramorum]
MKWSIVGFVGSVAAAILATSVPVGGSSEPRCFPKEFMFGTATAAYQVEGAWNEGGRTPSIWDEFCRDQPGMLCANVADDFYHRYPDDLNLMQDVGLQSLRFSISWSRAMTWDPETRHMRPNPEGIAFYHALIDAMNAKGIVPILTIYHWDLPAALMHELTPNGWLSPEIVDHYVEYATLMFQEYGHKVDFWTTFNEPLAFVGYSYGTGMFAPGHKGSPTEAYTVSRNVLVAHAKAVHKFRELKSNDMVGAKARIGIVLVSAYFYPLDENNPADVAAAQRALDFDFGWFLEPIVTGDYPAVMRERAGDRLPTFTAEESALLKGSYDIFMMNHYYSKAVTDCDSETSTTPCSSLTAGWEADKGVDEDHMMPGTMQPRPDKFGNNYCGRYTGFPPGYLDMMRYLHSHDPTVDILLTENGWCGNQEVENWDQLTYYKAFVDQVYKAVVEEKIPVVGYTAWSFLDNYEWGSYGPRFGLYYVNFTEETGSPDYEKPKPTDLERIPRPAAKWFHKVSTTKCLDGWDDLEAVVDSSVARSAEDFGFSVAFIVIAAVGLTVVVVTFKRRLGYQRVPASSSN